MSRRRFLPTSTSAELAGPESGAAELAATMTELAEEGSRGKSWPAALKQARRFDRWYQELYGRSIDERRQEVITGAHGMPLFPAWLWLGWVAQLLDTSSAKASVVRRYLGSLSRYLRGTGWDLSDIDRVDHLTSHAIANWAADGGRTGDIRAPARPVLADQGLYEITDAIDAHRDDPRVSDDWVVVVRAYHLLSWYAAARISELVVHGRWSWLRSTPRGLELTFPAGLKHQEEPLTVLVDRHPSDSRYCAVAALEELRRHATEAGIPTGPDDPIFGWARKRPVRSDAGLATPEGRPGIIGRRGWVADPIAELLADPNWKPGLPSELRVEYARDRQRRRFREAWQAAAVEAGFEPRHPFERVSPHGLRRGHATSKRAAGASTPEVAAHLRHSGIKTTFDYIDTASFPPADVSSLIPLAADSSASTESPSQLSRLAREHPGETVDPAASTCGVVFDSGQVCGRPATSVVLPHGSICRPHAERARAGIEMGKPWLLVPDGSCGVPMDTGEPCGRQRRLRPHEEFTWICGSHARRLLQGSPMGAPFRSATRGVSCTVEGCDSSGPHFYSDGRWLCPDHARTFISVPTSPQSRTQPSCQVVMDTGELCGRESICRAGEFDRVCRGHYARFRSGHPMGVSWLKYAPEGQTCEVVMYDGSLCRKGGRMRSHPRYGWICSGHDARAQNNKEMERPFTGSGPPDLPCEIVMASGQLCDRDRAHTWIREYGWICRPHYQRHQHSRDMTLPWGAPRG